MCLVGAHACGPQVRRRTRRQVLRFSDHVEMRPDSASLEVGAGVPSGAPSPAARVGCASISVRYSGSAQFMFFSGS